MRIRSIKPEFYRSDDISVLAWEERLLFIGLWSYVDDNGVGMDRLASITADLFSGDIERDSSETFARVSRGLQTLSEAGRITRYTVDGKKYLHITNWAKHQRIDKPNKERYPLPTCDDAEIVTENATPSRQSRETPATGTGEQGNRGTGEVKTSSPATPSKEFEAFWDAYPKKISKQAALKAWNKAVKIADPADIIAGAKRYAQMVQGSEKQFIKGPDGWLNAGRWEDETPGATDRPSTGAASVVPIGYAWANR